MLNMNVKCLEKIPGRILKHQTRYNNFQQLLLHISLLKSFMKLNIKKHQNVWLVDISHTLIQIKVDNISKFYMNIIHYI